MSRTARERIVAASMEQWRLAVKRSIDAALKEDPLALASIIRTDERFSLLSPEDRKHLADFIEGKLKQKRGRGRSALNLENPITRAEIRKWRLTKTVEIVRQIKRKHPQLTYDQITGDVMENVAWGVTKAQVLSELHGRGAKRRTK